MMARMMSLGSRPGAEPPGHLDAQRVRPQPLPERLRGQDVLDLAGADPEGQRPEGAVGAGVAVAADDRQARQRQAQLGTDHVDDPLVAALDVVKRDAELAAVGPHRLDLPPRQRVANVELVLGRHVVIDGGERQVRPAHPAPGQPQAVERLRTGHLVDQVPVDVQQRRFVGRLHHVAIPDLLEQCLGHFQSASARSRGSRAATERRSGILAGRIKSDGTAVPTPARCRFLNVRTRQQANGSHEKVPA